MLLENNEEQFDTYPIVVIEYLTHDCRWTCHHSIDITPYVDLV